ncbi:MFS transporter, DHA1 family, bicyclomycin/chloramphenicol resistance protein [Dyadobacter soli]|uniref:MFS transporter, DHA1 family, bicyclomycin/chloramphenicol resistance protein n=1 Tax=Dyadobacter soli TaxID=659014 RepID=A0A1G7GBZ0_9BACT|nr:multidrug effflux MFS transporter [Dyadobacter soli]SDE85605.1 MFS transporter, DHA1 family, bicyclomycin/chloramphenicol resistance protein [Dyadobacter soli]
MMQPARPVNTAVVILVLGMLTALAPLSIDMYLPAFPDIARDLHTHVSDVALSLSFYFVGVSVGQLAYGPLLERFGRKKPLIAGVIIYILAAAACAFATSVSSLIAARLFQAIGGCVGMVASRAIIRDLFPTEENARVLSMLMLVTSVSPLIAPTAGGMITGYWGWRATFIVMIGMAVAVLAGVYWLLPESHQPNRQVSLNPKSVLMSFLNILKNRQFLFFTLAGSLCSVGLFGYITSATTIFLDQFHIAQQQLGWIVGSLSMAIVAASQVNNLLLKKFEVDCLAVWAAGAQSVIGIVFVGVALLGLSSLAVTIVFIFALLACLGFIFPNTTSLAMEPMGKNAGNASALMGAIQMLIGAGASAFFSMLPDKSVTTVACIMAGCAVLSFAIFASGRRILQLQD